MTPLYVRTLAEFAMQDCGPAIHLDFDAAGALRAQGRRGDEVVVLCQAPLGPFDRFIRDAWYSIVHAYFTAQGAQLLPGVYATGAPPLWGEFECVTWGHDEFRQWQCAPVDGGFTLQQVYTQVLLPAEWCDSVQLDADQEQITFQAGAVTYRLTQWTDEYGLRTATLAYNATPTVEEFTDLDVELPLTFGALERAQAILECSVKGVL